MYYNGMIRPARLPHMKTIWRDLSLAWRNVLRQRRRSAAAIGAVAFGVCALLLAGGFIEYIYWATREGRVRRWPTKCARRSPESFVSGKLAPEILKPRTRTRGSSGAAAGAAGAGAAAGAGEDRGLGACSIWRSREPASGGVACA